MHQYRSNDLLDQAKVYVGLKNEKTYKKKVCGGAGGRKAHKTHQEQV